MRSPWAALAWVLPGEGEVALDRLLGEVAVRSALVPALWWLEVGNILLVAERRGRLGSAERRDALDLLHALPIETDGDTATHAWGATLMLAATHGLTLYDASCLELAQRRGLPLATLDSALRRAAGEAGIALIPEA